MKLKKIMMILIMNSLPLFASELGGVLNIRDPFDGCEDQSEQQADQIALFQQNPKLYVTNFVKKRIEQFTNAGKAEIISRWDKRLQSLESENASVTYEVLEDGKLKFTLGEDSFEFSALDPADSLETFASLYR